mmetsp:Transcript_24450/g.57773  ORF Transcript_24450/g.57773 Transcript_24450/m.57773 type:complete len:222 (-) Transcript_24450:50-715(-)
MVGVLVVVLVAVVLVVLVAVLVVVIVAVHVGLVVTPLAVIPLPVIVAVLVVVAIVVPVLVAALTVAALATVMVAALVAAPAVRVVHVAVLEAPDGPGRGLVATHKAGIGLRTSTAWCVATVGVLAKPARARRASSDRLKSPPNPMAVGPRPKGSRSSSKWCKSWSSDTTPFATNTTSATRLVGRHKPSAMETSRGTCTRCATGCATGSSVVSARPRPRRCT